MDKATVQKLLNSHRTTYWAIECSNAESNHSLFRFYRMPDGTLRYANIVGGVVVASSHVYLKTNMVDYLERQGKLEFLGTTPPKVWP